MVTINDVKHIAKLSKIEFEEEELPKFQKDLNEIVGYMDILNSVDVSEIKEFNRGVGVLREDSPKCSLEYKESLKNSKKHNDKFFIVPKVVE